MTRTVWGDLPWYERGKAERGMALHVGADGSVALVPYVELGTRWAWRTTGHRPPQRACVHCGQDAVEKRRRKWLCRRHLDLAIKGAIGREEAA